MQIPEEHLKLIGEFTYRYIRFERYLTDNSFAKYRNGDIYPDIKRYSETKESIAFSFDNFPELKKEIKKKKCVNEETVWVADIGESQSFPDLLQKVTRIRHNLFHGSKILVDQARDISLLKESLQVLALIESHDSEYKKYL